VSKGRDLFCCSLRSIKRGRGAGAKNAEGYSLDAPSLMKGKGNVADGGGGVENSFAD